MSIKAWYPFYPMDFLRDTELLCLNSRSLYREILDLYWINEGIIHKNDVKTLANKRGFSTHIFNKHWPNISKFFPVVDDFITNARMDKELDTARLRHKTAVGNGKAGAQAKAKKKEAQMQDNKTSSPQSPSVLPSPVKDLKEKALSVPDVSEPDKKFMTKADHEMVIDIYTDVLPELSKPDKTRWHGSARAKALSARWKESSAHRTPEFWTGFFETVRENPFWMGDNDRGWKADLEWLVNRTRFDQVYNLGMQE